MKHKVIKVKVQDSIVEDRYNVEDYSWKVTERGQLFIDGIGQRICYNQNYWLKVSEE